VISTGNDQVNVIRQLLIELLQERSRPLWKRLVVVGYAVEELATHADAASALRVDSLRRLLVRFRQGEFDRMPASTLDDQALQIELVMELIVSRLGAEYTTPRFLQCYSEFIRGLNWTMESTMEDVIGQYRTSFLRFWSPFISRNEHSLENYLVNYAFRTLFPFGQKRADQKLAIDTAGTSMWDRYALLVTHYTIVRTLVIGMSGVYANTLGLEHLVRLIQSYTKAFQHSDLFAATAVKVLREKGIVDSRSVVPLVTDQPAARIGIAV
jgi:lysine-N-methylase